MIGFYASDMSLSVGAVAEELGISASTLRSWERRYGLGPSDRESGTRRQYRGGDIARLRRMVELIRAGVPTKEAAAQVKGQDWDVLPPASTESLSVEELIALALDGDDRLPQILEAEAARSGLLSTYVRVVVPAMTELNWSSAGVFPGRSPEMSILVSFVAVIRGVMDAVVFENLSGRVTALSRPGSLVPASVTAAELALNNVDARVLTCPAQDQAGTYEVLERHIRQFEPRVVIFWGFFDLGEDFIDLFLDYEHLRFIQISESLQEFVHPRLQRVRTISAAVEEATVLANVR